MSFLLPFIFASLLVPVIYTAYCIRLIHRYLSFRNDRFQRITAKAENNKPKTRLIKEKFVTTERLATQEQFDLNMKYFRETCQPECGVCQSYINNASLKYFQESFSFLQGPRAVLLQLMHPLIAISGIEHSYVYKKSNSQKLKSKSTNNISKTPRVDHSQQTAANTANTAEESEIQCPFGFTVTSKDSIKDGSTSSDSGTVANTQSLHRSRSESSVTVAQEKHEKGELTAAQAWKQIDPRVASKALKLRFYRTFQFLFPICLGPFDKTVYYCKKVWQIHNKINGTTSDGVHYSALMIRLLLWVWATLVESTIMSSTMLYFGKYGDLDEKEKDIEYLKIANVIYDKYIPLGMAFGLAKDDMPCNYEEFEIYFHYFMCNKQLSIKKISKMNETNKNTLHLCDEAVVWAKMLMSSNMKGLHWLHYGFCCMTGAMVNSKVRDAFNLADSGLMPHSNDKFGYWVGVTFLGLLFSVYSILPVRFRMLNSHKQLQRRVYGKDYHSYLERLVEKIGGNGGDLFVHTFLET